MSEAECVSMDIITTLPLSIIETILCLIPIEEAARTSILSRDWRYKWTTIPKLVFHESIVSDTTSEHKFTDLTCKLFYAIHQVLLMRHGPINEFTLSMNISRQCFEIDQIISHLSRNHSVKKLKLVLDGGHTYKLPLCAFSLHKFTDLYLEYVDFDHQPTFTGLGSLRTLCLENVTTSKTFFIHLLSNCPSITSLTLDLFLETIGVIELFGCLPALQQLTIRGGCVLSKLHVDSVPKELPSSLIYLNYFCIRIMRFVYPELHFLLVSIKRSPNLEKIRLQVGPGKYSEDEACVGILEEYSNIRLEHLYEMEIENLRNLKAEMEFVKFILARSPKLKKVWISTRVETDQEQLKMLKILLRAPRASSVEIIVE